MKVDLLIVTNNLLITVCGSTSTLEVSSGRIVGGKEAGPSQWPSLTLLYNKQQNTYCTATLITPLWAVASYYCVVAGAKSTNDKNWKLIAGSTNKSDNSTTQLRNVEEIIQHPQVKFLH